MNLGLWIKDWIGGRAYPSYACELCVGQEAHQGCYCQHYGAFEPLDKNLRWHDRFWRWVYDRIYGAPK